MGVIKIRKRVPYKIQGGESAIYLQLFLQKKKITLNTSVLVEDQYWDKKDNFQYHYP
jgi:hypothetical protein